MKFVICPSLSQLPHNLQSLLRNRHHANLRMDQDAQLYGEIRGGGICFYVSAALCPRE